MDILKNILETLMPLLRYGGILLAVFCLIAKRRDKLAVIGFSLTAVAEVLTAFYVYKYFGEGQVLWYAIHGAAWGLLALFGHKSLMKGNSEKYQKLWYLPGAVYAAAFIGYLLEGFSGHGFLAINVIKNIFQTIIFSAGLLGLSMWVCYPNGLPREQFGDDGVTDAFHGDGYCGMVKHILLSLVTFGVWQLMWIYRTTRYLNQVEGHERMKASTQVIACLFLPFYMLYWTYKNAMKLDDLSRPYGFAVKLTLPCLALQVISLFNVIMPSIVMQERINTIAMCKAGAISAPIPMEDNPDQLPEL